MIGYIVLPGIEYEGLYYNGEERPLHWDRTAAETEAASYRPYGEVIEVSVELPNGRHNCSRCGYPDCDLDCSE